MNLKGILSLLPLCSFFCTTLNAGPVEHYLKYYQEQHIYLKNTRIKQLYFSTSY